MVEMLFGFVMVECEPGGEVRRKMLVRNRDRRSLGEGIYVKGKKSRAIDRYLKVEP